MYVAVYKQAMFQSSWLELDNVRSKVIGLRVLCTLENAAIQCTKPNYCTQISCVLTTG